MARVCEFLAVLGTLSALWLMAVVLAYSRRLSRLLRAGDPETRAQAKISAQSAWWYARWGTVLTVVFWVVVAAVFATWGATR